MPPVPYLADSDILGRLRPSSGAPPRTYVAVARELGVTPPTVRSRYLKAIRRLALASLASSHGLPHGHRPSSASLAQLADHAHISDEIEREVAHLLDVARTHVRIERSGNPHWQGTCLRRWGLSPNDLETRLAEAPGAPCPTCGGRGYLPH